MADFSNNKFEITRLTKTIIKFKVFDGIHLTLQDGEKIHQVMVELSKGDPYAVLMDASNFFSSTDQIRELLASKEIVGLRYAAAGVVKLLSVRLMGQFFINFNKPASPTKIFNTEEKALNWLKEQERIQFRKI